MRKQQGKEAEIVSWRDLQTDKSRMEQHRKMGGHSDDERAGRTRMAAAVLEALSHEIGREDEKCIFFFFFCGTGV
jgi:hypothetical protein